VATATLAAVHRLEIKRQMSAGDIAAVNDLLVAAERADGHRPLSDHLWLDLVHGGREGFAGLVASQAGHEHPVGYAQVSRGNESWALELVVHPHHRYEMATLGPQLLHATIDVVRGEGGGHVHWWVFEPTDAHVELAAGAGLRPGRRLYQMRCELPAEHAVTISTRPFVPGVDDEAWLAVNNRAFEFHAEQGGWDLDTLRRRQHEPWFDPTGFLLHERDGRLAGFCWTKLHTDTDPVLGEIYVIAVDPEFHGLGLGAQLTLAGLQSIHARGVHTGMLYVDADNTAAVAMYRKLGFRVHRTDRAFVGDVPAAPRTHTPAGGGTVGSTASRAGTDRR
jgi:mycothiol synthase